jgi:uncharacterized membrane protein YjjP (DUF1212 family)
VVGVTAGTDDGAVPASTAIDRDAELAQSQPPSTTTADQTSTSTTSTTTSSTTSTTTTSSTTSTTPTTVAGGGPATSTTTPEGTTTTEVVVQAPEIPAAVSRTDIPLGSMVLAVAVLAVVGVLVFAAVRRKDVGEGPGPAGGAGWPGEASRQSESAETPGPSVTDRHERVVTLRFLLELARALVDVGDPVDDVEETVLRVGTVNGLAGIGVVALPTALMISLPGEADVQTEVSTAGRSRLRLDQTQEIFEIVARAEFGELGPADGLVAIERARRMRPSFAPAMRLFGAALFTLGAASILRAGWADLLLAAVLGVGVGALQLVIERWPSRAGVDVRALWPLLASFAVSVVVFTATRVLSDVTAFAPIVSALLTFLPGGLLTIGVLELARGGLISGAGRLASGGLQLALLALGIVAGAQLIGVPASSIAEKSATSWGSALAWTGVAVYGVGIFLFHGGRRWSLGWMLVVLYVAYAGQVIGGAFFGGALSAFIGALAMTPFAVVGARRGWGPAMLVSFLPAFWLLVPGALGLEGVTRFIGGDGLAGFDVIVVTGSTMLGIALGVLLGRAVGSDIADRRWGVPRLR